MNTLAESLAELERIREARKALQITQGALMHDYVEAAAKLWDAEAAVWASLTRAPDYPHDTPAGELLMHAAVHGQVYAGDRAMSWRRSVGLPVPPAAEVSTL